MLSSGARVNRLTLAVTCQTHNQCFNLYLLLAPVASMELGKGALGEFHMIRDLMALRAEDFGGGAHILCTFRTRNMNLMCPTPAHRGCNAKVHASRRAREPSQP